MRDIDRTGQEFDGRPAEPVPPEIQQTHRNALVVNAGAGNGVRGQPVLPVVDAEREIALRGEDARQCSAEAVHVLADTRPLRQCRTVVEEDAHAGRILAQRKWCKSLPFNRLTVFFALC